MASEDLYLAMAGHMKSKEAIGIGVYKGSKQISSEITDLRIKYNYRNQIKYKSSDKYKINFCKELIDLFRARDDGQLYIKIIDNPHDILRGESPLSRINFRIDAYAELIQTMGVNGNNNTLFVKSESPFGPSRSFKDKIETTEGLKFKLRAVKSYEDDILQMTSFLTGNVISDLRGRAKNKNKIELLDYLKQNLGITNFEGQSNIQDKIIII